jgi:probable HAF family extracellular repeat protein
MNSWFRFCVAVLMFWMVGLTAPLSSQSNFSSFDFPGAVNTQATGITPSGSIVGRYTSTDGIQHGFLFSDGKFRSIDFPNATSTDVTWINPRGQIVGDYFDTFGNQHGFLLNNGVFATIDFPNAQGTAAFGIGATEDIIGIYGDSVGTLHGFLLSRGKFSTIDFPGATGTLPTMISAGRIVGGYFSSTGAHGFLLSNGKFQTIDCPGSTFTFLSGINPEGQLVGGYGTFDGKQHGALIDNGNCIPVDISGGTHAYANAIDPQGDVVGRYTDADGIVHGYLLSKFVKTTSAVYSAAHDFSFTQNPNAVWSYGFTTTVGGPFSLYTISGPTFFSGEVGWFGPISGCCAPGYPLVVAGPDQVPTVLDMGPGPSSYTVVRWTAPSRGRWDVVGVFFGTGATTGDVHVLHNGVTIFNSPVNGSQVAPFSLAVNAAPGDTLDFAAGPGPDGDNGGDPTGFNATITPEF